MEAEDKRFNIRKILDTEWIYFAISILCGFVICFIVENKEWSDKLVEAALGTVITYFAIYLIKNPYGKFRTVLKNNNEIIEKSTEKLSKSDQTIKLHKEELQNLLDLLLNGNLEHTNLSKQSITVLLKYLAEESFGKCSNKNGSCSSCARYKSTCDGLFRTYLREDCLKLADSIEEVNSNKKYKLDNNIPYYHTLAIKQLKVVEGEHYRVVQTLLDTKEPVYDEMDRDFLATFIEQIFMDDYVKAKQFKVQWIFVGKHSNNTAKNNYEYLVDELKKADGKIKESFLFKTIPQDVFRRLKGENDKIEETRIDNYYKNNPSLGIFGDGFVFVDAAPGEDQHGTMYSDAKDITNLIKFYNKLWNSQEAITNHFDELVNYCKE